MRGLQTKMLIATDQVFNIITIVILAWALYYQLLLFFAFSAKIQYKIEQP